LSFFIFIIFRLRLFICHCGISTALAVWTAQSKQVCWTRAALDLSYPFSQFINLLFHQQTIEKIKKKRIHLQPANKMCVKAKSWKQTVIDMHQNTCFYLIFKKI
jgi:hypothetical protein